MSTTSIENFPAFVLTNILQELLNLLLEKFPDNKILQEHRIVLPDKPTIDELEGEKKKKKNQKSSPKDSSPIKIKPLDPEEIQLKQLIAFGKQTILSLQLLPLEENDENSNSLKQLKEELLQVIEKKYQIIITEKELFHHPETNIQVIARIIQNQGKTPYAPILVDATKLMEDIIQEKGYDNENMFVKSYHIVMDLLKGIKRKKIENVDDLPKDLLPQEWFQKNALQSNIHQHFFDDNISLKEHEISKQEENSYVSFCLQVFGVFFYVPIIIYLFIRFVSWKINIIFLSLFLWYVYYPDYSQFPPFFQRHFGIIVYMKYLSYKCILEAPAQAYEKIPTIYTFGPHGIFGIAPALQALINGFLVGEYFHVLGANAVFLFPLYNILLRMMGFEDISYKTFKSLLTRRHSVAIIPGGIGEMFYAGNVFQDEVMMVKHRKGFIKIALETGSQIVPTYCFGSTHLFYVGSSKLLQKLSRLLRASLVLFWGKYGLPIPLRVPMVTVVGTPIKCPKIDHPSKELIDEYHSIFLKETQRIYENYKNTYGWQTRNLIFKAK